MSLLTTLLALTAAQASDVKSPQIIDAALYKNGYSALVRRVELDADGDTMIGDIRPSMMGTFWIYGSPGLKLDSIVNTTVTNKTEVVASSVPEVLRLNKGAQVTLHLKDTSLKGKLVQITSIAMLETADGTIAVNVNDVVRVTVHGVAKLSSETSVPSGGLRVKANGKGTLYLLSVETGLDWHPQYWFDILDNSHLKFTMRTTVENEIGNLAGADLSFVAGSPNLPMVGQFDPFTLFGAAYRPPMGGSGGGRPSQMQNAAPAMSGGFEMGDVFDPGDASGESMGELFYYKRQKVNLAKDEKGYYVLFEAATTYSTLYTTDFSADVADDAPLETWQSIKFKNTSGVPLTTAVATAYRESKLIGQDILKYTPSGSEGTLKLARAVDISSVYNSSETSGGTLTINDRTHQVAIRTGTVTIHNTKPEEVVIEVQAIAQGEVQSADSGGEIRRLAERLTELNPMSRIKWTLRLKANEKRQLKFAYKRVL
ncbi:MAG: hypothetical protein JNK63_01935 [Chthonomonas sp.]|nr:hypothetical protein [Chthonomonas sp.]